MLELDHKISYNKETIDSLNLCDHFTQDDLTKIGDFVFDGYYQDKQSRAAWERRTDAAMNLAMQLFEPKTYPWVNCSNVKFPAVTIAAMQFSSRAYASILRGPQVVNCTVNGQDPDGTKKKIADIIGKHMTYQVMEEDKSWEEQFDRLLINLPVIGCAFKKTYRSYSLGYNVSELVLAKDLVIDYYAKSVEDCSRKTQIIYEYKNSIHEKIMTGMYRDVRTEDWYKSPSYPYDPVTDTKKDDRTGSVRAQPDESTAFTILEQHINVDLDKDGYQEPYIITIDATSKQVLRIIARVDEDDQVRRTSDGEIVKVSPTEYFTKYGFIPNPDGSIYDTGFGVLLGPLNEAINTSLNQLVDAGTMSNLGGGFKSRGAKLRGGATTFAPNEWKDVEFNGDDLRKAIVPLPTTQPSNVLLELLNILINYTNRVSGSTDMLTGENPGQNTPATTSNSMVEQGLKIYNSLYKRVWRSMKEEFKKLFLCNRRYYKYSMGITQDDKLYKQIYSIANPDHVIPYADPNITSEQQRLQQATAVKQSAMQTAGYDLVQVEKNYLEALGIPDWQVLYVGPEKAPPRKDAKVQVEELKVQSHQMKIEADMQKFIAKHEEDVKLNQAKILQLEAHAAKLMEEASGVATGHEIAAFEAAVGAAKAENEELKVRADVMLKEAEMKNARETKARDQ